MSFRSLLVHDVTIVTPATTTDRYGNVAKNWDTATDETVKGWISQRSQVEDHDHREAQVSEWVLFLHPEQAISPLNRVTWSGLTFDVDGPANPAWTPRGLHHQEVPLRVVTG